MNESDLAIRDVAVSVLTPVVSVSPVVLPASWRGEDLHVRVSVPTIGHELPIIVFSHGFNGESQSTGSN